MARLAKRARLDGTDRRTARVISLRRSLLPGKPGKVPCAEAADLRSRGAEPAGPQMSEYSAFRARHNMTHQVAAGDAGGVRCRRP